MSKKTVLVLGGAGYIGSHAVCALYENGYDVITADNLSTGHSSAVRYGELYEGDIRDGEFLEKVFDHNEIFAVMNFAAMSLVGESMGSPLEYYQNNVEGIIMVLEKMKKYGVKNIVFSSTAAVYGEPKEIPIREQTRTLPTNPYGETKLAIERMLYWCDKAYGIKSVCLRYFNVAGANYKMYIGEAHKNETHLIPIVLQVALGRRKNISVFGDDYPTMDGTCIRDYIDVSDLCDAHVRALKYLEEGNDSDVFNLGNGNGFSVQEIIDAARRVTKKEIPQVVDKRRPGDPAILVAMADKAKEILQWEPKVTVIDDIIFSAWQWHKENPNGYK